KPTIKKPTTKKPITKKPTTTTTKKSIMSKKSSKKEFNNGVSCNKSDSHNECALKFRSSPAITPSLYFAVTQQQGWETGGLRSEQPSRNTHPDMEDAYYVPYMANEKVHYPSDTPYTLFVLADGHGGSSASRHFCRMVPEAIQDVLCSQASWSFREPSGQQLFREKVKEMYKRLDNEYLSSQKKKFSEWLSNGCKDPMPSDQGSTLVIVILYDGVVINCNLGDSMALICKTLPLTTTGRIPLEIVYQSTIHSPGHPHKAYHIASNGLLKARIYRPEEFQNPYGMQSDLSLNLGDTMGDLYFKLDPPLFPCDADVDYIVMESGTNYIGILAPDGLWDHLKVSMREFIRKLAKYINYLIASEDPNFFTKVNLPGEGGIGGDESSNKLSETESVQQQPFFYKLGSSRSHNILTGEQLYDLARALCDRTKDSLDIFEKDQGRYDDCTVIAFSYSF
ncbi:5411_t:CDS:2, partial [Entrophospora sp. SA101]